MWSLLSPISQRLGGPAGEMPSQIYWGPPRGPEWPTCQTNWPKWPSVQMMASRAERHQRQRLLEARMTRRKPRERNEPETPLRERD
ncbi:hypothetical protein GJAV_G00118660 [Gymnothorax javanicus]|nr:hypothetical protein GJAV_G00118660 [Gymnothorax javanicus]